MSAEIVSVRANKSINWSLAIGPNPPWTNVYFDCEKCPARYQLGAADECRAIDGVSDAVLAPACWHCGHINIVPLP